MRFAFIPFVLALSAVAGAQQTTAPKTKTPQPSVPPPINFPFPPLMPPPAGGLTSPVPFNPSDPTRPAGDLYRVPAGQPFNSAPPKPSRGFGGGAYFGPIYPPNESSPTTTTAAGRAPAMMFGMLRLDVTPESTQVFVDSFYAGRVEDIEDQHALALATGPHRIELRAEGYRPVTFDVRIEPHETINYRAGLERALPTSPVASRPAGPTRLYVIPGCYAGNLPPRADRLPAGCDIKQVRILDTPR